jgi:hypothetical protein
MAVRTRVVGIKRKRRVASPDEAQPNVQSTHGRKTLPKDQAAALRRKKLLDHATPGPAMEGFFPPEPGPATTEVRPARKTASRRKVKRRGV